MIGSVKKIPMPSHQIRIQNLQKTLSLRAMDGARGLQLCRARASGSVERQDDPQARSRSDWREFCHNGAKLMTKGAVGVDLVVRFLFHISQRSRRYLLLLLFRAF